MWEAYKGKKAEVEILVRTEKGKDERKVTEEVRKDNKKKWDNINKLRGTRRKNEDFDIYDEDGNKLEKEQTTKEIVNFWERIYKKHENRIEEHWNKSIKERYIEGTSINEEERYPIEVRDHIRMAECNGKDTREDRDYNKYPYEMNDHICTIRRVEDIEYPLEIREHMDMAYTTTNQRSKMPVMDITEEKVKKILTNLKNGKATGPDGLKGELYKAMANSKICLETLTKCYKKELNIREKPEKWKTSKTKLLKKKNKPTVKDLRPLALTDISYKIFMSLIKQEIEEHLINIKEDNEVQAGFKKGGRIEDNLLTLRYCVKDAYATKRQ